jgi:hypothetical protein
MINQITAAGEDPDTWMVFNKYMVQGFGAIDSELSARYELERLMQTGSVEVYAREMQALLAEMVSEPMDERSKIMKFHTGLESELAAQVPIDPATCKPWISFTEAVAYAIRTENAIKVTRARHEAAGSAWQTDDDDSEPHSSEGYETSDGEEQEDS